MLKTCLIFISFIILSLFFITPKSYAAFTLTGIDAATGSASVALPISSLQITGSGTEPIPVKLRVANGTLAMSTITGLSFTGGQTGSTLYFSGTLTNVNNALATLTYTRGSTGSDTLEVSLVEPGEVFFTENNHLYKFISGSINATTARTSAANQTAYGATGYLATITSQAENDFVAARLQGDGWMGASDEGTEGDWKWVTGPEAGTSFWSGVANGHTVGDNYANWANGEPNQSGEEDCGQFYISSSKWNDLPCSGSNLAGYIVEFGAPENLPTVTAKNITISIVTNPTLSSVSPSDGSTNVGLTTNLTITFSKVVSKGTGNILIKKSSDDSIVETIDVTSPLVTGDSTNTITINPSTTLEESMGYYITIPGTAFKDSLNNFYAGISSNTAWNFTTGDFTGPTIDSVTSGSITSSGAIITWSTNENTSSQVRYGLTSSFGTDTSITDTSPRVTSHSVSLTGLLACTTYYYQAKSIDASSNATSSSGYAFTTTGCPTNSTPTQTVAETVTVSSGGSTNLTESDSEITVQAPPDFTHDASSVVIQIQAIPNSSVLTSLGRPENVPLEVGDIVFDVKAIINDTTVLDSFDTPITITYQYSEADIAGIDESSLWLYHYHNSAWEALSSCVVNSSTNTISCTTDGFSIFGLFGRSPTSSSNTSSSSSRDSCQAVDMAVTPDLFQIDTSSTKAKLYFTPLHDNVSDYIISYGYSSQEQRFAVKTGQGASTGVLSYIINDLNPNTTYYFKIQPLNNCSSGNWSNEMKITTTKQLQKEQIFYKNIISMITSLLPRNVTTIGTSTTEVAKKKITKTEGCQSYVIKPGDTLWKLAVEKFGSGYKYKEIMTKNALKSTTLSPGNTVQLGCS